LATADYIYGQEAGRSSGERAENKKIWAGAARRGPAEESGELGSRLRREVAAGGYASFSIAAFN